MRPFLATLLLAAAALAQRNLYSLSQELSMGKRFGKALLAVTQAHSDARLDALASAIVLKTGDPHQFSFMAFDKFETGVPGEIFAFPADWRAQEFDEPIALPGGAIFVPRSLIDQTQGMDELAALLAHAVGHVVLRHPTLMASLVGVLDTGRMPNFTEPIPTELGRSSRAWELDADRYAVRLLKQLGFDPHALVRIVNRLPPPANTRLPLHPTNQQRLDAIDLAIDSLN